MKLLFSDTYSIDSIIEYLNKAFSPVSFSNSVFLEKRKAADEGSLEYVFLDGILDSKIKIYEFNYKFDPNIIIDESQINNDRIYAVSDTSLKSILKNNVISKIRSNPRFDIHNHRILMKGNDLIRIEELNVTVMFGEYDIRKLVSVIKQYYFESRKIIYFPYPESVTSRRSRAHFYSFDIDGDAFNRIQLSYIASMKSAADAINITAKKLHLSR